MSYSAIIRSASARIAGRSIRWSAPADPSRSRCRLSATERSSTQPASWRSSGTSATPAAPIAPALPVGTDRPSTSTVPASSGSRLASTSHSSAWPLPSTPARPTISPAPTSRSNRSRTSLPSARATVASRTASTVRAIGGVGCGVRIGGLGHETECRRLAAQRHSATRPSPWPGRGRRHRPCGSQSDTRPCRRIVITSVARMISSSLWLTSATALPSCSTAVRNVANRYSDSCGVSTDVGSSKITMAGIPPQALDDLHPLSHARPTGRRPERPGRRRARTGRRSPGPAGGPTAGPSWPRSPSTTFSHTRSSSTRLKCWWTMPMPRSAAPLRVVDAHRSSVAPRSCRRRAATSPISTFISVDLPAPFSPSTPWISPARRSRSMPSHATHRAVALDQAAHGGRRWRRRRRADPIDQPPP